MAIAKIVVSAEKMRVAGDKTTVSVSMMGIFLIFHMANDKAQNIRALSQGD
ncbi:hypothetical protein NBRC116593_36210 [Sulfitobacter pacificus]